VSYSWVKVSDLGLGGLWGFEVKVSDLGLGGLRGFEVKEKYYQWVLVLLVQAIVLVVLMQEVFEKL
jgi:hypothetical protein